MDLAPEFIRVSRQQLQIGRDRIDACLRRLSVEQIWNRDHEVENSVGNLVLHLCGNLRQWILSGIGGEPDRRERAREFAAREPLAADELLRRLAETVGAADTVLAGLTEERLLEERRIQAYEVTVLHAVHHVVIHFAGHVGQIIWATKHATGQDLGFYRYLDRKDSSAADRADP